jgi:hypothetical protein
VSVVNEAMNRSNARPGEALMRVWGSLDREHFPMRFVLAVTLAVALSSPFWLALYWLARMVWLDNAEAMR